ncbi:MAG: polysaccharide deacetylase family protein [Proteobacteria bacterium]|nr:polysaccharide deacetylase family protein [Pseudomonadota bacterium]
MSLRWRPAPALPASALLHAGAALYAAARPGNWPWALGAVVVNHAVLTAGGLLPRSRLLGPNWVGLPPRAAARGEIAITVDDGPDPEVTPRLLDLFDTLDVRASFFCVGAKLQAQAVLAREICRRGHSVENHSQHHPWYFSLLGPARMEREIREAQDGIAQVTGVSPRFFRAPAGLRNPFLDYLLAKLDLTLASWTRRGFDTLNGDTARVHRMLARNLAAGDILLLHDGRAAHTPAGVPVILEVLPLLMSDVRRANLSPVTLPQSTA